MTQTASERFLTHSPANLVAGDFRPLAGGDGDVVRSLNQASPDEVVFESPARLGDVADAVAAARAALPAWSGRSLEERVAVLRRWQELTKANADRIADLIVVEMGKVRGECLFEANALGGKVDITLGPESISRVTDYTVPVNESRDGDCRFKPHGVMAVIGPFNFPAHLPNGHWVPALLTGNTIVFK
ncbi:MAG TPA: succinylglutamate-semialdehyde dehydrogenase, partial [Phycisphaerales bacterium]|nr:succinylglutamate-semialdehyde dehydrogenase [Phycisphaerales bacterium]